MSQWHPFDKVLTRLKHRGFHVHNTTENGDLSLMSDDGQFGTLPCGGEHIEDSVVRHNWGHLLDVDDLLSP